MVTVKYPDLKREIVSCCSDILYNSAVNAPLFFSNGVVYKQLFEPANTSDNVVQLQTKSYLQMTGNRSG